MSSAQVKEYFSVVFSRVICNGGHKRTNIPFPSFPCWMWDKWSEVWELVGPSPSWAARRQHGRREGPDGDYRKRRYQEEVFADGWRFRVDELWDERKSSEQKLPYVSSLPSKPSFCGGFFGSLRCMGVFQRQWKCSSCQKLKPLPPRSGEARNAWRKNWRREKSSSWRSRASGRTRKDRSGTMRMCTGPCSVSWKRTCRFQE